MKAKAARKDRPFAVPEPKSTLNRLVEIAGSRIAELMTIISVLIPIHEEHALVRYPIDSRFDLYVESCSEPVQAGALGPCEVILVTWVEPCIRDGVTTRIDFVEEGDVTIEEELKTRAVGACASDPDALDDAVEFVLEVIALHRFLGVCD